MRAEDYTYRWLAISIAFLGVGGAFALLVGLSRTPFGHAYLPPDFLHQGIVGHVVLAIIMWLISFTVVLWSRYLNGVRWAFTYTLAFIGALLVIVSVFDHAGVAVINNYVPTMDSPVFFIGLLLFFIAFAVNTFGFLGSAVKSVSSEDPVKGALSVSVVVSVALVVSMIFSVLLHERGEYAVVFFERLFWVPGHIQQLLNGTLLIAVWYCLARGAGIKLSSRRFLRPFNYMLIISAILFFAMPFFTDPVGRPSRIFSEIVYAIGLGVPVFAHGFYILSGVRGARGKYTSIPFISMILSMTIYLIGMAIAYTGFGNDLRVPAHYHGAVTGLTLAMMGVSYGLIRDRIRRGGLTERILRIQPLLYGLGMILVIAGLMVSGHLGAPRKTYGVGFSTDPVMLGALTVMGIGTLLAVAGGILFVISSGAALFKRKPFLQED